MNLFYAWFSRVLGCVFLSLALRRFFLIGLSNDGFKRVLDWVDLDWLELRSSVGWRHGFSELIELAGFWTSRFSSSSFIGFLSRFVPVCVDFAFVLSTAGVRGL